MVLNSANSHISLLAVKVMLKVFTVLIKVSICARNSSWMSPIYSSAILLSFTKSRVHI